MSTLLQQKITRLQSDYQNVNENLSMAIENLFESSLEATEYNKTSQTPIPLDLVENQYKKLILKKLILTKEMELLTSIPYQSSDSNFFTTFKTEIERYEKELNVRDITKLKEYNDFMIKMKEITGESTDGIVITGQIVSFTCPLTQQIMDVVWTSKRCNHNFSSAILKQVGKGQIECPAIGCNRYVSRADLFENKKLQRTLERQMAQSQSEDEDTQMVE